MRRLWLTQPRKHRQHPQAEFVCFFLPSDVGHRSGAFVCGGASRGFGARLKQRVTMADTTPYPNLNGPKEFVWVEGVTPMTHENTLVAAIAGEWSVAARFVMLLPSVSVWCLCVALVTTNVLRHVGLHACLCCARFSLAVCCVLCRRSCSCAQCTWLSFSPSVRG